MVIILAILFIWFGIWFTETFSKFCGTVLAAPVGYFCFMWGLNFIGSENFTNVQIYGWMFMTLAAWMALTVISTIYEIIEDIRYAQPDKEYCGPILSD
jgi:hypothetical protein